MEDNRWLPLEFEEKVKAFVLETLGVSRDGFNGPHTLAAVHWMKWLLNQYSWMTRIGKVLILSIYLHDIGWAKIPEEDIASQKLMHANNRKVEHMRLGAEMAQEYLTQYLGLFVTEEEIEEIVFYVANHDDLDAVKTAIHQGIVFVVMADTLGQIDTERVAPTLKLAELEKFLTRLDERRRPFFSAYPKAMRQLDLLLAGFRAHFEIQS